MNQPPSGTRVLIVEDDSIIAMMAEDMLEETGCKAVAVATTVAEALDHLATTEFEIVLLDLNLKDETSLPVAQALHAQGKPFIFATGYDGVPAEWGFEDRPVITKPYRIEHLGEVISKALAA